MEAAKVTYKIEETINGNFIVIIRNYFVKNIYTRKVKYGFKTKEKAQKYIAKLTLNPPNNNGL